MTYVELAEAINKEIKACFAYTEDAKVVITYRGKKADKIFIERGIVTNVGNTESVAIQIAEKYNLKKA